MKKMLICFVLIMSASFVYAEDYSFIGRLTVKPVNESGKLARYYHNVDIFDEEYIENSSATNVTDIIGAISGTNVKSDGRDGNIDSMFIRGGLSGTEVAVFVDGIRIDDPSSHKPLLNTIPINSIEKIEVIKGGASSLYGAGAMSGVVNIVTKKDVKGVLEISAHSSLIGWSGINYYIRKGVSYLGGTVYAVIDNQRTIGDNENNDTYDSVKKELGLNYKVGDISGTVKYYNQPEIVKYPGATVGWGEAGKNVYNNASYFADINYKDTSIKHSRSVYSFRNISTYGSLTEAIQDKYSINTKLKSGYSNLFLGYDNIIINELTNNNHRNEEKSYLLGATYGHLGRFFFIPSFRHVNNDDFGVSNIYSLGVNMSLFNKSMIKASYSQNYQNPTIYQRANSTNLKPEFVNEVSTGFDYFLDKGIFSCKYFRKSYYDRITYTGVWPNVNYENQDKAVIKGMEYSLDYIFSKVLKGNFAYTDIHQAYNLTSSTELAFVPERSSAINLIYTNSAVSVYVTYKLKGDYIEGTTTHKEKAIYDMGVNYDKYYVKIHNLLDLEYDNSVGYPAPRRRVYIGAKQEF
jgi:vitamin B12 transporter